VRCQYPYAATQRHDRPARSPDDRRNRPHDPMTTPDDTTPATETTNRTTTTTSATDPTRTATTTGTAADASRRPIPDRIPTPPPHRRGRSAARPADADCERATGRDRADGRSVRRRRSPEPAAGRRRAGRSARPGPASDLPPADRRGITVSARRPRRQSETSRPRSDACAVPMTGTGSGPRPDPTTLTRPTDDATRR